MVRGLFAAGLWLGLGMFILQRVNVTAQEQTMEWSEQEKPIVVGLHGLRGLPDDVRAATTKNLALKIQKLPVVPNQLLLANGLANLSTEGDFGHDTLQQVTTALAKAVLEQPVPAAKNGDPAEAYVELAELACYEHMETAP
jgi:hypothetical protein